MSTDGFKAALAALPPCHCCDHPATLDSVKGHAYCSHSTCDMFKYKMPQSTWTKLGEVHDSKVVQFPQSPNIELQRVVDSFLYVWHNRQDTSAIGALEDTINDYEAGRPHAHTASLLEHAAFKTKKLRDEIDELKEENRRLERNSITLDGVPTTQAAINALVARVDSSKKQLQNIEVWGVEDDEGTLRYSAFHRWMCEQWAEKQDDEEGYDYGVVCLNVQGVPDLYGEGSSENSPKKTPSERLQATTQGIVISAQKEAAKGLKEGASPEEVARAQLRVMSALLATLSYTLTQTSPTV